MSSSSYFFPFAKFMLPSVLGLQAKIYDRVKLEFQINNDYLLIYVSPMQFWDKYILTFFLFILNSNLFGCSVFLFAISGNPNRCPRMATDAILPPTGSTVPSHVQRSWRLHVSWVALDHSRGKDTNPLGRHNFLLRVFFPTKNPHGEFYPPPYFIPFELDS